MKTINLIIIFCLFVVTLFVGIYFGRNMGGDSGSDFAQVQIEKLEEEKAQLETEKRALEESLEKLQEEIAKLTETEPAKGNPQEESTKSSADMEKIKQKIEGLLKKRDPKFQDFTYLYNQVFGKPGWNELDWETKREFLAYYRISDILLNGDADAIKGIMDPEHPDIKLLSETHRWQVLAIGYGIKDEKNVEEFSNMSVGGKMGRNDGIKFFIHHRSAKFSFFESLDAFKNGRSYIFSEE